MKCFLIKISEICNCIKISKYLVLFDFKISQLVMSSTQPIFCDVDTKCIFFLKYKNDNNLMEDIWEREF